MGSCPKSMQTLSPRYCRWLAFFGHVDGGTHQYTSCPICFMCYFLISKVFPIMVFHCFSWFFMVFPHGIPSIPRIPRLRKGTQWPHAFGLLQVLGSDALEPETTTCNSATWLVFIHDLMTRKIWWSQEIHRNPTWLSYFGWLKAPISCSALYVF